MMIVENRFIKEHLDYFELNSYNYPQGHSDYFLIPRPYTNLIFIKSGYAKLIFDGSQISAVKGDIIFVPQSAIYNAFWCCEKDIIRYSLTPKQRFYTDRNTSIQVIKGSPDVFLRLEYFKNFSSVSQNDAYAFLGNFFTLLGDIYPHLHYESSVKDSEIQDAIVYIHNNLCSKLYVHDLAKLCKMSEAKFFKLFKSITGYTPTQYKNIVIMQKVQDDLIKNFGDTIDKISQRYEFSSAYYFCKLFKQITGYTPSEFRQQYRESH